MSGKAPSEGQKVTAGKNAPYTTEATGPVANDSLAAESQAFRQGNEATPQQAPREGGFSTPSQTHSSSAPAPSNAGTAPTYVHNAGVAGRPHGKNLKEDDSIGTEDREKNASFSEFGTKNDPGAAAEQKFSAASAAAAGPTGGRQQGLEGNTPYDALGPETSA